MVTLKCPECGKEVPVSAKMCVNCGYLIAEDVECLRRAVGYEWPDKNSPESKHLVFEGMKAHIEGDYRNAWEALSRAAELGSAVAQYYVGKYYALGRVVPEDDRLAFEWYEKAAAQKYTDACHAVGLRYLRGEGTEQNIEKGLAYLHWAAGAGHTYAAANLGHIYTTGEYLPVDYEMAVQLYENAMLKDDGPWWVLRELGTLYMDGKGTDVDFYRAHELFNKLLQKKPGVGKEMLAELKEKMAQFMKK